MPFLHPLLCGCFFCAGKRVWRDTVLLMKRTVGRLFFCAEAAAFTKNASSATTTPTGAVMRTKNFRLNKAVLEKVTGIFGDLEVINSGSVFELDKKTLDFIKQVCKEKR